MSHIRSGQLADELIEVVGTGGHAEEFSAVVRIGIIVVMSVALWAGIYIAVTSLVG